MANVRCLRKPLLRLYLGFKRPLSSSATSEADLNFRLLQDDLKGVAVFGINRPASKNAIGKNLLYMLEEAIERVKVDRDVRAVILKSDVPGIFCAGADLKERATMKEEDVGPFVARARRMFSNVSTLPMPVITALDGGAFGGGMELALATDIRIAADSAKMGLVETRLAIIPGGGGTQRLSRLVGIGKAKELIFTAKVLTGQEAAQIGLVEHVVSQNGTFDAAYEKALEVAKAIIGNGPVAVRMAKYAIDYGMQTDINTAMKIEEACYAQVIPTKDRLEALKAFSEKRTPIFKGE